MTFPKDQKNITKHNKEQGEMTLLSFYLFDVVTAKKSMAAAADATAVV